MQTSCIPSCIVKQRSRRRLRYRVSSYPETHAAREPRIRRNVVCLTDAMFFRVCRRPYRVRQHFSGPWDIINHFGPTCAATVVQQTEDEECGCVMYDAATLSPHQPQQQQHSACDQFAVNTPTKSARPNPSLQSPSLFVLLLLLLLASTRPVGRSVCAPCSCLSDRRFARCHCNALK